MPLFPLTLSKIKTTTTTFSVCVSVPHTRMNVGQIRSVGVEDESESELHPCHQSCLCRKVMKVILEIDGFPQDSSSSFQRMLAAVMLAL